MLANGLGREPGPRGWGRNGRSATGSRWLPSQLDSDGELLVAPVDAELDLVAGLLARDRVAELVDRVDRRPVDGVDQVAAARIRRAGDDRLLLAGAKAGLRG